MIISFMAGFTDEGYVKNCFATGNATGSYAGGFAAMHNDNAVIENCYRNQDAVITGGTVCTTGNEIKTDTFKTVTFGTTLTWSTEIWVFTDEAYPTLK